MPSASPGKFDEAVPVSIVARKARHLETEHKANMAKHHFGSETRKTGARDIAGTGETEVLVDHQNALGGPSQLGRLVDQCILAIRRFTIVFTWAGLDWRK